MIRKLMCTCLIVGYQLSWFQVNCTNFNDDFAEEKYTKWVASNFLNLIQRGTSHGLVYGSTSEIRTLQK